jgi:hypothetical protein
MLYNIKNKCLKTCIYDKKAVHLQCVKEKFLYIL